MEVRHRSKHEKSVFAFIILALVTLISVSPEASENTLMSQAARLKPFIEKQRKKLLIPGLAVVIVQNDQVCFLDGFGYRDFEKRLPVTSDSLFGLGSCTKAFTGLAVVISAEAGKLSLDDSPKKFLPYFHLADPKVDAQVTLKDMLLHRTGLKAFDDEVWHNNDKLSREEVIKAVMLKPSTAKFRTAFQYNNVMYSAVGECVGRANESTWEKTVSDRIFKPLGMVASNTSMTAMRSAPDFTIGYHLPAHIPVPEKDHDLNNVAAAGGINSSARDLVQWIRFMLNGGTAGGQRLVSEQGFERYIRPEIGNYALGWEVIDVNGHKTLVSEGGAVGHAARITLDLQTKVGWAVLANVNNVREFRLLADFVDQSLQPSRGIIAFQPWVLATTLILWIAFTLRLFAIVRQIWKRQKRPQNLGQLLFTLRHSIRTIATLTVSLLFLGIFIFLSQTLDHKPWIEFQLPALPWANFAVLACACALLESFLFTSKNPKEVQIIR